MKRRRLEVDILKRKIEMYQREIQANKNTFYGMAERRNIPAAVMNQILLDADCGTQVEN